MARRASAIRAALALAVVLVTVLGACGLRNAYTGMPEAMPDAKKDVAERSHHEDSGDPWCKTRTDRPVIGILSQPANFTSIESEDVPSFDGKTYIAASYVRWIEQTGARVLPIMADDSTEELDRKFKMTHGLLFPGGEASMELGAPYLETSAKLYSRAMDEGNYPIHGTCLGLEVLSEILAGMDDTVCGHFDGQDYVQKLSFTPALFFSRLIKGIPYFFLNKAASDAILYFNHHRGLSLDEFKTNPTISRNLNVLATAKDKSGDESVAIYQSKDPYRTITGFQFHPEKAQFEWHVPSEIPHSGDAIVLSTMFAFGFVDRARCNHHRPKESELTDYLIYNYNTTYSGKWVKENGQSFGFEEIYLFDKRDSDGRDDAESVSEEEGVAAESDGQTGAERVEAFAATDAE